MNIIKKEITPRKLTIELFDIFAEQYPADYRQVILAAMHTIFKGRGTDNDEGYLSTPLFRHYLRLSGIKPEREMDTIERVKKFLREMDMGEFGIGFIGLDAKLTPEALAMIADFDAASREFGVLPLSTPHRWTSPTTFCVDLVTGATNSEIEHMQYSDMPRVYDAVNYQQSIGYVMDTELCKISDWITWIPEDPAKATKQKQQLTFLRKNIDIFQKEMYFFVTMDSRGRMYYRSPINPSNGGDFSKALFKFTEAKPLGKDGLRALAINYANHTGNDKLSLVDRETWAHEHGLKLAYDIMGKSVKEIQDITGEDKIFCLYTAAMEWRRVIELVNSGKAHHEIESQFIVRQDGTCNGIQHGAALMRDRDTGLNVNICESAEFDTPEDIYSIYRDRLLEALDDHWSAVVDRKFAKPPVMIKGYGAGKDSIMGDLMAVLKKSPQFQKELPEIMDTVMDELNVVCAAMEKLTNALRTALSERAEAAEDFYWKTQDGFPVIQKNKVLEDQCYYIVNLEEARKKGNEIKQERLIVRNRDVEEVINFDVSSSNGIKGIAPNFVHSIDANHLRNVVNGCEEQGITILHTHDEFDTHACDYFRLNDITRGQFVKVHEFDWLGSLESCSDVVVEDVRVNTLDLNECLEATYMFS
ncbi:MAG: hypothetical protein HRU20_14610 [Pseudomonadales bacterium]|nr:hypothetical protein [Pseudomonadales bacterium]